MSRAKKDARIIHMKLDRKVYDDLERFSEEKNIGKTAATELILAEYLTEHFTKPGNTGD